MPTFDSENQPSKRRGKAFKTKMFEAIKAKALLETSPNSSNEDVEAAFIQLMVTKAFTEDDGNMLVHLLSRAFPPLKQSMDTVNFNLDPDSSPSEKAQAVLVAVAQGEIPPDVGTMLINASKAALDIEALTELKERIDKLERVYERQQSGQTS
jgi:hypothetical protein